MSALLAAAAVLTAVLVVALHREFRRIERERVFRMLTAGMRADLEAFRRNLGEQMIPTMQRLAAAAAQLTTAFRRHPAAGVYYRRGGGPTPHIVRIDEPSGPTQ